MKEILPMWKMCRLLNEARYDWAFRIIASKAKDSELVKSFEGTPLYEGAVNQQTTMDYLHLPEYRGPLKVYEGNLLIGYIHKYFWNGVDKTINLSQDTEHKKDLATVRAILENCKSHKPAFIQAEGDRIFLTGDGERFSADKFELFKEYIESMGPFKSHVVAAIVGIITGIFGALFLF